MRDERRRVAITGIGVVSPAGIGVPAFWREVVEARTAIAAVEGIAREGLSPGIAAQVRNFSAEDHLDRQKANALDRFSQFAVIAAREALADSGLDLDRADRRRIAAVIGTGSGGMHTVDQGYRQLYAEGAARLHPMTIPRQMVNAAVSQVCMDLGLNGEAYCVSTACASGTHAIGQAFRMIRAGDADIAFAGGSESCITPGVLKAWQALRVMSSEGCRPFSRDRSGMVLGEGAATLILESFDHARKRGAPIYALIEGFGATADAGHLTSPSAEGAARAIQLAMADAGMREVDYINAHGTGTALNDASETRAIRLALGTAAERVMVSSSKGVLGHALGAAGALEAAVTALALHCGLVPPTAGWREADPECDLDVVPNIAREVRIASALSNSFAFGGLNAVLAFGRA